MKGLLSDGVFLNLSTRYFTKPLRGRVHCAQEDTDMEKNKTSLAEPAGIMFGNDNALVRLSAKQTLAFDGCAMVCLTEGTASMHGYSLNRGTELLVKSCSTLSSAALTFQTGQGGCVLRFSSHRLEEPGGSLSFTLEVFSDDNQESNDAGPQKWMHPTIIPCEWSSTAELIMLECDSSLPVVPVCGEKDVGKSTFARFLVNRFLSSYKAVAYIDTDVGQPEFTIPGCLSLHILEEPVTGPHLLIPQRCFFYGDILPQSDPKTYCNYFKELYDYFRRSDCRVPLVINSHGWRAGTGFDLLVDILRYCMPTHVVEIQHGEAESVPPPLPDICPVLRLSRAFPRLAGTVSGAAQLRALRVLHYFRGLHSNHGSGFADVAKALACQVPYKVSADDFNVVHLHGQVPSSQRSLALNAQLVGLATAGHQSSCVGFGIIRGVDLARRTLYILTPCSLNLLEQVDTILQGRVGVPVGLLQVEGYRCPYLCTSQLVEGIGSSVLRRRKRKASSMSSLSQGGESTLHFGNAERS